MSKRQKIAFDKLRETHCATYNKYKPFAHMLMINFLGNEPL